MDLQLDYEFYVSMSLVGTPDVVTSQIELDRKHNMLGISIFIDASFGKTALCCASDINILASSTFFSVG